MGEVGPSQTNHPEQFVQEWRPSEFNHTDPSSWFERSVSMLQGSNHSEQYAFISDIIHTHVREIVEDENYFLQIQDGLAYSTNPDSLVDDFVFGVDDWNIFVPQTSLVETVSVVCQSSTFDTADVTNVEGAEHASLEPSFERTTYVDCVCSAEIDLTVYGFDGSASIAVSQSHLEE